MQCAAAIRVRTGSPIFDRSGSFPTPLSIPISTKRSGCDTSFRLRKFAPDAWLAIGLNRKNGDYRDRDLSLLRLVAPHIIEAHRRLGKPDAARLRDCNMTAALTPREKDVLGATRSGKTNAEIGAALGISGRTVQKHLESIFWKIDVHRRTAAALAFVPRDGERRSEP